VGIEAIDICLPADRRTRYFQEGVECAKYIKDKYPYIDIAVLTPTTEANVEATMDFADRAGVKLSPILFRGSSDLRLLAEGWNEDQVIEDMYRFSRQLTQAGHHVIAATEDTTRSRPDFLMEIIRAGKAGGAKEFCIADTVGFADPNGISNMVKWIKSEVDHNDELQLQFHGHDDTRNAVSNSMSAIMAGADTIHVTWLGVGERAGNTPLEAVLSDLVRRGIDKYSLNQIVDGSKFVSEAYGIRISDSHPLVGKKVFSTESGIHAAGIRKAEGEVRGIIYSAVDPKAVGREHEVNIGPLGGTHSVRWVLERFNIEYTNDLKDGLLAHARKLNRALTDTEILNFVADQKLLDSNGHNY
jgi:2-isopropylmalate synthase